MNKKFLFSYLISLIFLAAIIYFVDLQDIFNSILKIGLFPSIFLGLFFSSSFIFRGIKWKYLLEPFTKISVKESFDIINTSFFANAILPARIGELVRAYILHKRKEIGKVKSFSTILVDRIVDGFVLIFLLIIGFLLLPEISNELKTIGIISFVIFFILILIFLLPEKIKKEFQKIKGKKTGKVIEKIEFLLNEILTGEKSLKQGTKNQLIIWISGIITWLIIVLFYYYTAQFIGIEISLAQAIVLNSIAALVSMIPSAPSNIGTYEGSFGLVFLAFGLNVSDGIALGVLTHLISTIVIFLIGFFSIRSLGIDLKKFKSNF